MKWALECDNCTVSQYGNQCGQVGEPVAGSSLSAGFEKENAFEPLVDSNVAVPRSWKLQSSSTWSEPRQIASYSRATWELEQDSGLLPEHSGDCRRAAESAALEPQSEIA